MSSQFGGNSVYLPLKRVIVRKPTKDFSDANPTEWNYTSHPDLSEALSEHNFIVNLLEKYGAEVIYHDENLPGKADSIYVFDPIYMTDFGAIILKPGKQLRSGEETALKKLISKLDIPIILELSGSAKAEGGDMLWVDENTLAIGVGFRTNTEAVKQIKEVLEPRGIEVKYFDLPYFEGPKSCLHLLSTVSIVDKDIAVIYPRLMPVGFYQLLVDKGFKFAIVPDNEFLTMGPNVLAIAPKLCLMIQGNPETQTALENLGCTVHTYKGDEISLKSEGGPTCLTRPILRSTS